VGRRTRRTDHTLFLRERARRDMRVALGGGDTRQVDARRARGDG
jgi:hypothetical protein